MNRESIDNFIKDCAERKDLSENTVRNYRYTLVRILDSINKPVEEITAQDINAFIDGYYKKTRNRRMAGYFSSVAKVFFAWNRRDDIKADIRTWKIREKEIRNLNMRFVRKIMNNQKYELKYRAIVALMVSSGLRIGECLKLNVNDLDFKNLRGKVLGKGQKKTEEPEEFVFSRSAGSLINEWISSQGLKDEDPLFPGTKYFHTHNYFRANFRMNSHQLRHTFCTEVAKSLTPTDVKILARHKDFKTTQRYIHPDRKRAMSEYHKSEVE